MTPRRSSMARSTQAWLDHEPGPAPARFRCHGRTPTSQETARPPKRNVSRARGYRPSTLMIRRCIPSGAVFASVTAMVLVACASRGADPDPAPDLAAGNPASTGCSGAQPSATGACTDGPDAAGSASLDGGEGDSGGPRLDGGSESD